MAEGPVTDEGSRQPEAQPTAAGDLVVAIVLLPLCAWIVREALGMPRRGDLGLMTSPGFTPILVSCAIALLSLVVLAKAVRGGALRALVPRLRELAHSAESRRAVVLFALMVGYAMLIGLVPFPIVTGAYLAATFVFLRSGSWVQIAVATAVGVVLTGFVIPYVFSMPLP